MVEVIPSKWMRKYLCDYNRELSEWEKAAVLLHVPNVTWNTKLDSLQKLSDEVCDPRLEKNAGSIPGAKLCAFVYAFIILPRPLPCRSIYPRRLKMAQP